MNRTLKFEICYSLNGKNVFEYIDAFDYSEAKEVCESKGKFIHVRYIKTAIESVLCYEY